MAASMKKRIFCTANLFKTAFIIILLTAYTSGFSAVDALKPFSKGKYRTIETEYFYIHFPAVLKKKAAYLSSIVDPIHRELSKRERWSPAKKTEVVLIDSSDYANGYATYYPQNTIVLYMAEPFLESSISNSDNWLELMFIHEYTHTLNMDQIYGAWAFLRLFGPYYSPNALQPVSFIEGNAVYNESHQTGRGRLNSPYAQMIMRLEFYDNTPLSLSETASYPYRWPYGLAPYLYGAYFLDYLAETYGEEKLKRYFKEYSDNLVPLIPSDSSIDVFGKSFPSLWKEWIAYEKSRYEKTVEAVKAKGLSKTEQITHRGSYTGIPRFINNSTIAYVASDRKHPAALYEYNRSKGQSRFIHTVNSPNSIAPGKKNGEYIIADVELYHTYTTVYDHFELKRGSIKQKSKNMHALYIDSFKDRIAAVIRDTDEYRLVVYNKNGEPLTLFKSSYQLSHCRFDSRGDRIVFAYKKERGTSGIAYIPAEGGEAQSLFESRGINMFPVWHPKGKSIIFSSDKSGVPNLYELNLSNRTLKRITNLIGGATSCDISPDGETIAFAGCTKEGFDIFTTSYRSKRFESSKVAFTPLNDSESMEVTTAGVQSSSYNPLRHLPWPAFYPLLYTSEVGDSNYSYHLGAGIFGSDPLNEHSYIFEGDLSLKEPQVTLYGNYSYMGLYPDLSIIYYDSTLFYSENNYPQGNPSNSTQRSLYRIGGAEASIDFAQYNYLAVFTLGGYYRKETIQRYNTDTETNSTSKVLNNNLSFSTYLMTAKSLTRTILPTGGFLFINNLQLYNEKIGSDYDYYKTYGGLTLYSPLLLFDSIATLTSNYGYIFGDNNESSSFSLGKYKSGDSRSDAYSSDTIGIRGYPAGTYLGQGLLTASLEYAIPLSQKHHGMGLIPLAVEKIWISPFAEGAALYSDQDKQLGAFKKSAGAEIRLLSTIGFRGELTGFAGLAKGLDEGGELQVYFGISTLFASSFMKENSRNVQL
jgi:hypothetical protein